MKKMLKYLSIIILLICGNNLYAQINFSIDTVIVSKNVNLDKNIEIARKGPVVGFYCRIKNNTDSIIDLDFEDNQLFYSFNYMGNKYFSELFVLELRYIKNVSIKPFSEFGFEFYADIFGKHNLLPEDISIEKYFEFLLQTLPSFRLGCINGNLNIESGGINNIIIK
ncbi:MAG: hypothetical protein WC679_05265 [Bacteroidales bacterium]|jgi:hypothetical protein